MNPLRVQYGVAVVGTVTFRYSFLSLNYLNQTVRTTATSYFNGRESNLSQILSLNTRDVKIRLFSFLLRR
jgi:hypothetical protein